MFYLYTVIIPIIIAIVLFFVTKPNKNRKYLHYTLILLGILFIYAFIMYFLEMEKIVTSGWVFYSLIFFLIPSLAIVLLLKLVMFLLKRNK